MSCVSTREIGKVASLVVLMFFVLSCDGFLKENPEDFLSPRNFYESSADAVAGVNAIYELLGGGAFNDNFGGVYFNNYYIIQGLASDNMKGGQRQYHNRISTFTFGPGNRALLQVWRDSYFAINVANEAIAKIPPVEMSEDLKSRLIGEARFLRATLYFDLVRMFGGGIPRPTSPTDQIGGENLMPRSKEDIYAQIIEDYRYAEENLPAVYPARQRGRATSGAATGMLAKVHLFRENWEQASTKAEQVISSGQYALWDDYKDAFKIVNDNGKESVFSIQHISGGALFWEASQFNVRFLPPAIGTNGNEWELPTMDVYESFTDNDERQNATFITSYTNSNGENVSFEPHISKYWDREVEPNAGSSSNDFEYLRYSDILLIYAEALNEASEGPTSAAYDAVNQVRNRAGLSDLSSDLTQQEFRRAVWRERRHEFVAEGKRWFQLKRTGRLVSEVESAKPDASPRDIHTVFPIPQRELDQNPNLEQNEGY